MVMSWIKIVKTRKEHQCWGCGRTIPKGNILQHTSTVQDGDWYHSYFCTDCQEFYDSLNHWDKCELQDCGMEFGEFMNWDDFKEFLKNKEIVNA